LVATRRAASVPDAQRFCTARADIPNAAAACETVKKSGVLSFIG
jgi:hypothetical protein